MVEHRLERKWAEERAKQRADQCTLEEREGDEERADARHERLQRETLFAARGE
jgi:hypothetical protein